MSDLDVDVAIVGAGTAGMAAYREVRRHTDRVALIEGSTYGTTCARVGCMPSKLLIAPAEAVHRLQALAGFGLQVGAPQIDGRAVMERVRRERDRFVGHVLDAVGQFDPRHQVQATATFADAHTLALSDGRRLTADRLVLAVGSRPSLLPMFEAAGDRVIVNDDVFEFETLPDSVAVFGGGIIGLELGQALHRLGVRVALFGKGGFVGPLSDPQLLEEARSHLAREFAFFPDAEVLDVARCEGGVQVRYRGEDGSERQERFAWLLAATGRRSNLDRLNLEAAGLPLDARGLPVYDPLSMQWGDSHIFVAGDATGDLALLHEAADEGRLAGENAARFPAVYRRARRAPLAIMFSDPQIAIAGESYAELTRRGAAFRTGEVSFADQGRSTVMLRNAGRLHVYGEEGSGLLLGAEIFGPDAEHLAHLLAWSIQSRLTVGEVLERPFYHPVVEEGLRTALRTLHQNLAMGPPPPLRCIDCGPGG